MSITKWMKCAQEMKNLQEELKTTLNNKQEQVVKIIAKMEKKNTRMKQVHVESAESLKEHITT